MENNAQGAGYQVHRGGPGVWYVQRISDRELVALPFKTKKAAEAACARRNASAEPKRPALRLV